MNLKIFKYFFLLVVFFSISYCNSVEKKIIPIKTVIPLEILYKKGLVSFENGKYQDAIDLFDKVEKDYSYTEWAPRALLMKSYIYYENSDYIKALTYLKKYKKRYAGDKGILYSEYLTAMCLFEQINGPELSQENAELALKIFNKIIIENPQSEYALDAKFKIDLINEQFASKEMYLARYFIKRQKWTPAIYKLNNIVKNYQSTIFIEEALYRLVEINYKLGNVNSAKKYASILGYNYNDSDWYKKSFNKIEKNNFKILKKNINENENLKNKLKKLINF